MSYISITLSDFFGEGATQDASTLTILKSDLYGLTPTSYNSAESLLAAILLRASTLFSSYLVDETGNPIITGNNDLIGYENTALYELLNIYVWDGKYLKINGTNLTEVNTIVATTFTDIPAWE
jgi:hypothetical protein